MRKSAFESLARERASKAPLFDPGRSRLETDPLGSASLDGPIIHECADPSSLNTSVAGFYKFTQPPAPEATSLTTSAGNWVDVREVAEAHVLALTVEQAAGERYIVSAGPFANGQFTKWLRSSSGDEKLKASLPEVDESALKEAIGPNKAIVSSGAKAEKELGLKYRSFDSCTKDSAWPSLLTASFQR